MKLFNAGAKRRATPDARLIAANDLVQRTLAQHGLAAQAGPMDAADLPAMASISDLFAKLGAATPSPAASTPEIPAGASFLSDTFTCAAGSRSFRSYIPASATEGASGVVVMLHGCTQTPEDFAAGTGMNQLAENTALSWSTRPSRGATTRSPAGTGSAGGINAATRVSLRSLRGSPATSVQPTASRRIAPLSRGCRRGRRWP
ncbi:Esterase PHB depolymerase [Sulfitobacter dubius]|nr:Esterase PHB depolymerase [Sulfitobacter dubius]